MKGRQRVLGTFLKPNLIPLHLMHYTVSVTLGAILTKMRVIKIAPKASGGYLQVFY